MRSRRLVLALAAVLFFWNLGGAHDLWAPDEPYFAEGAREMLVDGRWRVPHVNGVVTTDKPPLFFWMIALLSVPAGQVTPWTARLPSAMAALGTILLVLRLGRRLGGDRVAWLASLTLCTTLMFWEKARWTQIDALLCFLIWAGLAAFEAWRAGDADGRRAGLLFWLAAALAVLAKGPVGLLLPLGIAVVTLASDGQLGRWRRFAPASGPLLFAVVVGIWMIVATHGGEYSVWGALREHFIDRAIHGMHHRKPPWYYLEVLPVHLLPWTGLLPGALLLAWRRRSQGDRFLLVVALYVVLFFSISTEKRHLYALPAVPALALMIARLVDSVAAPGGEDAAPPPIDRRWLLGGQAAVGGVLALGGLALPSAARRFEEFDTWIAFAIAALLLLTGVATLWTCRRSLPLESALALAAGFVAFYLFASTFVYPVFDRWKSARGFSLRLGALTEGSRAAGQQVVAFDLANLPEAFAFHSDGVYTLQTKDPQVLVDHLRQPVWAWAVMKQADLDRLPADLRERLVIAETSHLSQEDLVLVTNRSGAGPLPSNAPASTRGAADWSAWSLQPLASRAEGGCGRSSRDHGSIDPHVLRRLAGGHPSAVRTAADGFTDELETASAEIVRTLERWRAHEPERAATCAFPVGLAGPARVSRPQVTGPCCTLATVLTTTAHATALHAWTRKVPCLQRLHPAVVEPGGAAVAARRDFKPPACAPRPASSKPAAESPSASA